MITIILANDMEKGEEIAKHYELNPADCAVITEPAHLDHVSLIPNETVYAHASTHLLTECVHKMHQMPKFTDLNFKIINA